jgi:excinuclease UvrABC nuclease subunit
MFHVKQLTFDSEQLLTEAEIVGLAREMKVYCGIYFLILDDKIVYVGQSNNIYNRLARHIHGKSKNFNQFSFIEVPLDQLNMVETAYIHHFRPKYNFGTNGFLRTPAVEAGLNRGKSDRKSLTRQLKEYNKKWEGRGAEWAKMVAEKL